eukprot:jgi/Tetstr1/463186/TSEL_008118.t1
MYKLSGFLAPACGRAGSRPSLSCEKPNVLAGVLDSSSSGFFSPAFRRYSVQRTRLRHAKWAAPRRSLTACAGGDWGSAETVDSLRGMLAEMKGDPLEAYGGQVVMHRGSPEAKLMVIGEAPGAEEDRLGTPFVGRSGELLDRILAAVDIDSNHDAYITNIVKRRPPNNRDPLQRRSRTICPSCAMRSG